MGESSILRDVPAGLNGDEYVMGRSPRIAVDKQSNRRPGLIAYAARRTPRMNCTRQTEGRR